MTTGPGRGRGLPERGSVSVLTAGVLFLAGVLTMIGVDLLRTVQAQSRAQAAADAAALAAAQEIAIPSGSGTPTDAARSYAEANGATLVSCECEPRGTNAVAVVELPVRFIFVGPDRSVRAAARAVVGVGRGEP